MSGTATTGRIGLGAALELGDDDSPINFTAIANVVNMEVGGVSLNMVDATHVNSPDYYGEVLPGLKTSAPWTGTIQWDNSHSTHNGTTGLRKRLEDRAITTLRMNLTGVGLTVGIEADGYVSELGPISVAAESVMTQTLTFTPTGACRIVTITP